MAKNKSRREKREAADAKPPAPVAAYLSIVSNSPEANAVSAAIHEDWVSPGFPGRVADVYLNDLAKALHLVGFEDSNSIAHDIARALQRLRRAATKALEGDTTELKRLIPRGDIARLYPEEGVTNKKVLAEILFTGLTEYFSTGSGKVPPWAESAVQVASIWSDGGPEARTAAVFGFLMLKHSV